MVVRVFVKNAFIASFCGLRRHFTRCACQLTVGPVLSAESVRSSACRLAMRILKVSGKMEQDQHHLPTPAAAPNTSQRLHNEITALNNLTPPDLTLAVRIGLSVG